LPRILHDMQARGFKIVHVVPATADLPPTPSEPEHWQAHPTSESVPTARWPKLPNFIYAEAKTLAVPAASNFDLAEANLSLALEPRRRGAPLAKDELWPKPVAAVVSVADALPVPASTVFARPEKARAAIQPLPLQMHHYAEDELPPGVTIKTATAEPRSRRGRRGRMVRHVAHSAPAGAKRHAAHPTGHGKRAVHVASLKKRKI
jgi:hypothetical protein